MAKTITDICGKIQIMTITELINLLSIQAFPDTTEVIIEGCDCNGTAAGVEISYDKILITRGEGV